MSTSTLAESVDAGPETMLSEEVLDCCETILARLPWPGNASSPLLRTLGLTSCHDGEGVSTLAARLAVAAAGGEHKVLLVDANLANPSVHKTFSIDPEPGLSDVLLDPAQLPACVQPLSGTRLSILPAGNGGRGLLQNCGAAHLADLFEAIKSEFDLAIFDLPETGLAQFPLRLAGMLDGMLWVVEAERVWPEDARRTKELLARANVQVLGTVLNRVRRQGPRWLEGYLGR